MLGLVPQSCYCPSPDGNTHKPSCCGAHCLQADGRLVASSLILGRSRNPFGSLLDGPKQDQGGCKWSQRRETDISSPNTEMPLVEGPWKHKVMLV